MRTRGLMLIFCSLLLLNSDSFCEVKKEEGKSDWFYADKRHMRGGGGW